MKTKQDFFEDFFARLNQAGFSVTPLFENDVAAEVCTGNALFCVITQDGEIIYESYNADKARQLEQFAEDTRTSQGCCIQPPFTDMEHMEAVNLMGGAYIKVYESAGTVLLCRQTSLFGYEFITCQKAETQHNSRRFYREQLYYDPAQAQDSFMERSGLKLPNSLVFSSDELRVLMSCCARCVMLDNELDGGTESSINMLMARIERYLPPQENFSPRHYYEERNK